MTYSLMFYFQKDEANICPSELQTLTQLTTLHVLGKIAPEQLEAK